MTALLQGEKVYVRSFDGAYINAVLRSPGDAGREKQFHQGRSIREESELIDKGVLASDAHERKRSRHRYRRPPLLTGKEYAS